MPIEHQVAITLFRFGHYGNAAAIQKVALWAGVGVGTVVDCTKQVMQAVCSDDFRKSAIKWPDAEERLFENSWYDRKSNYSLNVQLISTPNLMIIDYGVGLPGSQYDATAWKETRVPREHDSLLEPDEWIWADTAYPLERWCQAPYKKPEKYLPGNNTFNYHSSLRGLRIQIKSSHHIKIATLWVISCVTLHCFAMQHEAASDPSSDEFYQEGVQIVEGERSDMAARQDAQEVSNGCDGDAEGKKFREVLKRKLLSSINQ
ncbi:hypothetical protein M422DRAFT_263560 [Sphaerobolus stellatus SS14]|uniref:DDE Tnp4 domain-containing protein n=1 Tax=Sphaerobolus stellatus (strain SS14) TaxID=990650 RepID=A0A0C9UYT6_SPHS4|nr:hypothetical protein M422DRAFT_263560 [Sphaerobolus stellatus SS14]